MSPDLRAALNRAGNRWGTVLLATAFTLLFEYSMRGFSDLREHLLILPLLAAVSLTYFAMVQDLAARFRLRDGHLVGVAFFTGTVHVFLVSGLALTPPLVLDVNPLAILFVTLVWWGALQTLLARYLASRLLGNGDRPALLSPAGWGVALAIQAGVILLIQSSGRVPALTPGAAGVMILLLIGSASAVKITLPPRQEPVPDTGPEPLWDILGAASVVLFLACAFLLTGDPVPVGPFTVNRTAFQVVILWSLFVAVVMAIHRLIRTALGQGRVDPLYP
ncbi:MAG: hypothetical protein LUQ64_02785 [Methanomicrobiales archaeon]|nr:hypothetical protein [Methanomicrobiales archaeon]